VPPDPGGAAGVVGTGASESGGAFGEAWGAGRRGAPLDAGGVGASGLMMLTGGIDAAVGKSMFTRAGTFCGGGALAICGSPGFAQETA